MVSPAADKEKSGGGDDETAPNRSETQRGDALYATGTFYARRSLSRALPSPLPNFLAAAGAFAIRNR
jgi:hypothetical protein